MSSSAPLIGDRRKEGKGGHGRWERRSWVESCRAPQVSSHSSACCATPSQLWQAHWQLGDKNRKFTEYVFKNTALFIPFLLDIYLSHWSAVVVYFASASVPVLDLDNTLCLVFVFWLRLGEPSNYCLAGFRQRDTPQFCQKTNKNKHNY